MYSKVSLPTLLASPNLPLALTYTWAERQELEVTALPGGVRLQMNKSQDQSGSLMYRKEPAS